ncbi:pyrophosphate--fructose 6-phosphate 1-phosphotransferase [Streptomyces purpurascens]
MIGGEDTLGAATELSRQGINLVGVPKTIDNDVSGTDYTFGFDTAVGIATEAIDRLHTTAESHMRALVVEVMGRHSGWIALHAGIAGGANVILIPERPFDIEQVCEQVKRRFQINYAPIVVVAEGATPKEGRMIPSRTSPWTSSAMCGCPASVNGWPRKSPHEPRRTPAPRSWGTFSAAVPRAPSTGGWPPASGCTPSTRSRRGTSAAWSPCGARESSVCPSRKPRAENKVVEPPLYDEFEAFYG